MDDPTLTVLVLLGVAALAAGFVDAVVGGGGLIQLPALLLGMITSVGWLERVPTYKEQQEQLREKDLNNYGFLGYPVLQTADVSLYGYVHAAGEAGIERIRPPGPYVVVPNGIDPGEWQELSPPPAWYAPHWRMGFAVSPGERRHSCTDRTSLSPRLVSDWRHASASPKVLKMTLEPCRKCSHRTGSPNSSSRA